MADVQMKLIGQCDYSPEKIEDLQKSIWKLIHAMKILFDSSQNEYVTCSLSCGELEIDTDDWVDEVLNSKIWDYMAPIYDYAEGKISFPQCSVNDLDAMSWDMASWCLSCVAIGEMSGEIWFRDPIIKTLTKFFARIKLDFKADFEDCEPTKSGYYFSIVPICSGYYAHTHEKYLTLVEVALLAGVKNIRTIRNAQYDKNAPLEFFKENGQVLVTVDVARKWLEKRRGFVKTPEIDW